MIKAASLWSGGKDSCFACYKVKLDRKFKIKTLLNFVSDDTSLTLSHGLRQDLVEKQLSLTSIPFLQKKVSPAGYEQVFKKTILDFKKQGVEAVVFGDIYLKEHRDWIDGVCKGLEVEPVYPLWNMDTSKLVSEFVEAGFKAMVVAVEDTVLPRDWLGRIIDKDFVSDLGKVNPEIDPCGERGEFHTLVVDGPIFKKPVEILEGEPVLREGFSKYWCLDIKKFR